MQYRVKAKQENSNFDFDEQEWRVVTAPDDPQIVDY